LDSVEKSKGPVETTRKRKQEAKLESSTGSSSSFNSVLFLFVLLFCPDSCFSSVLLCFV